MAKKKSKKMDVLALVLTIVVIALAVLTICTLFMPVFTSKSSAFGGAIANETDSAKILQLEEKYTKEFNTKKTALENDYNSRLSSIEKNIKEEIAKKAKAENYDYVFAKSVLLYGGKDITSEIKVK